MSEDAAPYHAHIYFEPASRVIAERLRAEFLAGKGSGDLASVSFVGEMRDRAVGPHPMPQYEVHFEGKGLAAILRRIRDHGLRALVHRLTDDDLADHTTQAIWIGEPLALDLSVLDPPGMNQGVARFGKSDF